MPENLPNLLRAGLGLEEPSSPLAEATPDTIDELLSRANDHLVAGLPERIRSDGILEALVIGFRAQAQKWLADEAEGKRHAKEKKPAGPKPDFKNLI